MRKIIRPTSRFSGTVRVPPDKSLTHRAILFSALAEGTSTIDNPLQAEDCLSTAACIEALGVRIEMKKDRWTVHGVGLWGFKAPKRALDCGNSGTTMRLLSGVLAAQDFTSTLKGDASLSKRPMNRVAAPLTRMGAQFKLRDGRFAPYKLTGTKNITAVRWENPVASAQVKSAVLLAALHAVGKTVYQEPTVSRDHTERMLKACGVEIECKGTTVTLNGPSPLKPQAWRIPGDISSAAFFMVGALLVPRARVTLESVNINPTRTGILDVLKTAGAIIELKKSRTLGGEPVADVVIDQQSKLRAFKIDKTIAPRLIDEIPILAVLATQCEGTSVFSGLEELRFKETDRLKAVTENLRKMGANVEEHVDGLVIQGPVKLRGAQLRSFDDHRIAMAFAVAGLIARGLTTITGSECVAISFPDFWNALARLSKR